jgi:CheY-like chemotaxis protein
MNSAMFTATQTYTATGAAILPPYRQPVSNTKPIVLLVEDDHYVSAYIWTLLNQCNFEVVSVTSGAEGLKLAQRLAPDVVVLDVDLPEMSGLEVCRRLKSDPKTSGIPVVFFSGYDEFAEAACDLGAEAFCVKPGDVCRLVDCLCEIISIQTHLRR